MATRRLLVEINAGKRRCKGCEHADAGPEPYCELFVSQCDTDEHMRQLRSERCKTAERRAATVSPPDLPECVRRWQASPEAWRIGATRDTLRAWGPDAADVLDWAATLGKAKPDSTTDRFTEFANTLAGKHAEYVAPITFTFRGKFDKNATAEPSKDPARGPAYEPRSMVGKP